MKSFIAKRVNSILVNLRYLTFKLLKYKKNITKFVILLIITSKIFLYKIMRKVSLERYYFVLYDGALTLKISKMALNSFCDKTLHIKPTAAQYYCTFQSLFYSIYTVALLSIHCFFSNITTF